MAFDFVKKAIEMTLNAQSKAPSSGAKAPITSNQTDSSISNPENQSPMIQQEEILMSFLHSLNSTGKEDEASSVIRSKREDKEIENLKNYILDIKDYSPSNGIGRKIIPDNIFSMNEELNPPSKYVPLKFSVDTYNIAGNSGPGWEKNIAIIYIDKEQNSIFSGKTFKVESINKFAATSIGVSASMGFGRGEIYVPKDDPYYNILEIFEKGEAHSINFSVSAFEVLEVGIPVEIGFYKGEERYSMNTIVIGSGLGISTPISVSYSNIPESEVNLLTPIGLRDSLRIASKNPENDISKKLEKKRDRYLKINLHFKKTDFIPTKENARILEMERTKEELNKIIDRSEPITSPIEIPSFTRKNHSK